MQRSKEHRYSITSSVATNSLSQAEHSGGLLVNN